MLEARGEIGKLVLNASHNLIRYRNTGFFVYSCIVCISLTADGPQRAMLPILSMSDGLYMEHYTKIIILLAQCKNCGDLHYIISSTKLDSPQAMPTIGRMVK